MTTPNARCRKIYSTLATLAVAAIIASVPVAAEAALLGLSQSFPDITSQNVAWDTPSTSFIGTASSFSDGTINTPITSGAFSLDPDLQTISISGSFTYQSTTYTGTLLAGNITAAGDDGAGTYDYLFNITSGCAAALFGSTGGTIIDEVFQQADTFPATAPVPEPATMSLMLIGGSALAALRRRRSHRS